jgi:hypothetical protein
VTLAEPIAVTLEVTTALDALGLRYLVGGSLASSVHGIPRSTEDVDLLVELPGRHVDALRAALTPSFYVDADMIRDAIVRRASFNIIHLATMFKVDIFVSDGGPLSMEEMRRAEVVQLGEPPRDVRVCTAEDIVVRKLDWFRQGDGVSERQWRDLLGVLRVRHGRLDLDYMGRWARHLGVDELLQKALLEADPPAAP